MYAQINLTQKKKREKKIIIIILKEKLRKKLRKKLCDMYIDEESQAQKIYKKNNNIAINLSKAKKNI